MKWFVFTGVADLKPFWRDNWIITRLWITIVLIFSPVILTYEMWKHNIVDILEFYKWHLEVAFGKWEINKEETEGEDN